MHLKEGQGSETLATLKNKTQLHSLVAKQLCQNISGKNTIVFTGPSITSLSLFTEFSKQGFKTSPCLTLTNFPVIMFPGHHLMKVSQWPIMTNVFRLCCHYKIMFFSWVTKKVTAKKTHHESLSSTCIFSPSVLIVFSTYCSFTDDADKNGGRKKIIVLFTENPQQSDARLFLLRSSFQDKEE